MDPTQNPQAVQAMVEALQRQQQPAGQIPLNEINSMYNQPLQNQQQPSLGNGAPPPGYGGMLNAAPPMTPPPAPIY